MEKESDVSNRLSRFSNPKIAASLFILIVLLVPFYESKKVLLWGTQRENQKENIFHSLVLSYASFGETLKEKTGIDNFFQKEHSFWLKIKKSPVVFQKLVIEESIAEKKVISEEEEIVEEEKPVKEENLIINGKRIEEETEEEIIPRTIQEIEAPFRILIIGDSFMAAGGGLGDVLERALLYNKEVKVFRYGKVSSGLARPDYFDWTSKVFELNSQFKPNIAVVLVGLNDSQALTTATGKIVTYYGSEKWKTEYAKRIVEILDIFEQNNITVFWIGLPEMRNKIFSEKMEILNSIYKDVVQNYNNAHFITTRMLLVDENGNYTDYLPDKNGRMRLVRISDGIHLQYFGGEIVTQEIIRQMQEVLKLEKK